MAKVSRDLASKRYLKAIRNIYPVALKSKRKNARRGPKVKYTPVHKRVIKTVWELYGCICAERLFPEIYVGVKFIKTEKNLKITIVKL